MSAYWNFPVLITGVFAALGLFALAFLLGIYLPRPYNFLAGFLLWGGVGVFYLGMRHARRRRR